MGRYAEEVDQAFSGGTTFTPIDGSPERPSGWQWTSYEQYAPDGQVIGGLMMLICPICGSLSAIPPDDAPETQQWVERHESWHRRLAKMMDQLDG